MKRKIFRIIISMAIAMNLFSVSAVAQKKNENSTYNLQRAYEVLKNDMDEEQALSLLKEQLQLTPDNVDALLLRARVRRNRSEYGSALSDLNQAIKVNNPKKSEIPNSTLYWWKATVYMEMNDYSRASDSFKQALGMARKDAKENVQQISFDYGHSLYCMDRYDEADAVYKQMLKEDETDQAAMVGLARNMIERDECSQAVELLDRTEKLDADYSEIYRWRCKAYDKMGENDKAIVEALEWIGRDEDARVSTIIDVLLKHKSYSVAKIKARMNTSTDASTWQVLLVALYENSNDYELAIMEYDKLEQEYGKDEFIYRHRSSCYDELGLVDLALSEIDKALEISDDAYNRGSKADILRSAARYEEAIKEYQTVIDKQPDNAYGYYALGWCHELSGDAEKAFELYNTGIDLDQSYPYIYLMRGTYYMEHGDSEKAKADFEQVVRTDTSATSGSCTHYALHFLGRDEEAEAWMDKIIKSDPYDPGHLYDKACLYARMGRLDESVKVLESAFEKGYVSFNHIRHDDDMDPVRDRDDFKELMEKYESKLAERIEKMGISYEVAERETKMTEVPISRHAGGTFDVACEVNGLALNMIFDTGASDVSISKVEADFMLKNNYISRDDIKGKKYYQTADGGISEGTIVTLKEVKIGDAVLHHIEASVTKSQKAPLLLGQSVLEKFGTFTVDNINSKLIIKH